ncbi:MAG: hypothetical protein WD200_03395 [Candidatus Andersenbacteria bacterium]
MRVRGRKYLFLFVVIAVASIVHFTLQDYLTSYIIAPLALATFLAYTLAPVSVVVSLVIIAELFSFLPPGLMTVAIIAPFGFRRLFSLVEPGLSGTFLSLVGGITCLQALIIGVAPLVPLWQTIEEWQLVWLTLPFRLLFTNIAGTTFVLFAMIILWYEAFPLQQDAVSRKLVSSKRLRS